MHANELTENKTMPIIATPEEGRASPSNSFTFAFSGTPFVQVTGTIDESSPTSLTLGGGFASAVDRAYDDTFLQLTTGDAEGTVVHVTSYDGTTKKATVEPALESLPSSSSGFAIYGLSGAVQASGTTSTAVALDGEASSTDDAYNDMTIEITEGTGVGQVRTVSDYVGSTKVATVSSAFATAPDDTSRYTLFVGWAGHYDATINSSEATISIVGASTSEKALVATDMSHDKNGVQVLTKVAQIEAHHARVHTHPVVTAFMRAKIVALGTAISGICIQTIFHKMKNLGTINLVKDPIDGSTDCVVTRSVLTGQTRARGGTGGFFRNVRVGAEGMLRTEIGNPSSIYGSIITTELSPHFQTSFMHGLNTQEVAQFSNGEQSDITTEGSRACTKIGSSPVSASASPGDFAVLRSKKAIGNRPGLGCCARIDVAFASPVAGVRQTAGVGTVSSALAFGYSEGDTTQLQVLHSHGGGVEVRRMQFVDANLTGTGDVTVTLAGNAKAIALASGQAAATVAGALQGEDAAWHGVGNGWTCFAADRSVYFVSRRAQAESGSFGFADTGTTGAALEDIVQLREGIVTEFEMRQVQLATGAVTATGNITVTLDGVANTVAVTSGDTAAQVAYRIVHSPTTAWASLGEGWTARLAHGHDDTVEFEAKTTSPLRTGSYGLVDTGTTGVTVQRLQRLSDGVDMTHDWVPQADWNVDRLNGDGPSGMVLDPTKANVYDIEYGWPHASVNFYVFNPEIGSMVLVHRLRWTNSNAGAVMPQAASYVQCVLLAAGVGLTGPHKMAVGAWAGFTQGKRETNEPIFGHHLTLSNLSSTTRQALLLLRTPTSLTHTLSHVSALLKRVTATNEQATGTGLVRLSVILNPKFIYPANTYPKWSWHTVGQSGVQMASTAMNGSTEGDLSAVTLINGDFVTELDMASNSTESLNDIAVRFERDDVLCFAAHVTSGTSNVHLAVTWVEDH